MKYISAIKKNNLLVRAATWLNFTDIILTKGGQT